MKIFTDQHVGVDLNFLIYHSSYIHHSFSSKLECPPPFLAEIVYSTLILKNNHNQTLRTRKTCIVKFLNYMVPYTVICISFDLNGIWCISFSLFSIIFDSFSPIWVNRYESDHLIDQMSVQKIYKIYGDRNGMVGATWVITDLVSTNACVCMHTKSVSKKVNFVCPPPLITYSRSLHFQKRKKIFSILVCSLCCFA